MCAWELSFDHEPPSISFTHTHTHINDLHEIISVLSLPLFCQRHSLSRKDCCFQHRSLTESALTENKKNVKKIASVSIPRIMNNVENRHDIFLSALFHSIYHLELIIKNYLKSFNIIFHSWFLWLFAVWKVINYTFEPILWVIKIHL